MVEKDIIKLRQDSRRHGGRIEALETAVERLAGVSAESLSDERAQLRAAQDRIAELTRRIAALEARPAPLVPDHSGRLAEIDARLRELANRPTPPPPAPPPPYNDAPLWEEIGRIGTALDRAVTAIGEALTALDRRAATFDAKLDKLGKLPNDVVQFVRRLKAERAARGNSD